MDSSPSLPLRDLAWTEPDVARLGDASPCMPLSDLPCGVQGVVAGVLLGGSLGDRLVELGFTRDASIRVLRRAPFGGPLQVQIREFILSLRREQARSILVLAQRGTPVPDA